MVMFDSCDDAYDYDVNASTLRSTLLSLARFTCLKPSLAMPLK